MLPIRLLKFLSAFSWSVFQPMTMTTTSVKSPPASASVRDARKWAIASPCAWSDVVAAAVLTRGGELSAQRSKRGGAGSSAGGGGGGRGEKGPGGAGPGGPGGAPPAEGRTRG